MLQMGTLRPTEAHCVAQGHAETGGLDWGSDLMLRALPGLILPPLDL